MDTTRTPEKESAFLEALAETGNVTEACRVAGIARRTVYGWRNFWPDFRELWDEAAALGVEALEDEARRRANGYDEPLVDKGRLTGDKIKKYSDTLTIFLLKGAKPEKYKDRIASEVSGPDGGAIKIDDATAADKLAVILDRAKQRREDEGGDLA
jgi:hypothetical protein